MKEVKNNAIQKTESIVEANENKKNNANLKNSKNNKKANRQKLLKKKQEERQRLAEIKKAKKDEAKRQKLLKKERLLEKRKAEKLERLENARLKKEKAIKARNEKLRLRAKKREDLKALKLKQKEERLKRRELLKHETKAEREKRLAKEKSEKLEFRRQKLEDKKAKRLEQAKERSAKRAEAKQKRQELAEERRQKRLLKSQERRERRKNNKGIGGWIAAVVSLGCTVLVLAGLLTLTVFTPIDDYLNNNTAIEKSFYDLVGYVDNLDVNLSKLTVSQDNGEKQKILGEVRVQSNLATASISSLPLQDEDKFYTTKFINQVGDFAKYLNNKLIDGKSLSQSDIDTINKMYEITNKLKGELSSLSSQIDENFNFASIYEGKQDNIVISKFIELESNSVDYPHMIYDGAFSEGAKSKDAKALKGLKEVSKMDAEKQLKSYFKNYSLSEVTLMGEVTSANIECYDFDCKTEDGTMLTAQISKLGGKLLLFNYFKDCNENKVDDETCQNVAEEFLKSIGVNNVKAVWKSDSLNTVTFNFCSVVDGVICYSDLIKVNVCKERGVVSGIEASSYYLNYTQRSVNKATISLNEASKKVNENIQIENSRLAIIPVGISSEVLAYEFVGEYNGETYYVYIDSQTGKEVEIFKVVKTTEGTLLM